MAWKVAKLQLEKDSIDKARIRAEQKVISSREKVEKYAKENAFLQDINKSLITNQEEWKTRIEQQLRDDSKDKKIQELEEQLRDMMFFIEAQKTVQGSGELQDGSVVVVPGTGGSSSSSSSSTPKKAKGTKSKKHR